MEKLAIGKIRTSTGVYGYTKVLSFSGEFGHFKKLKKKSIELKYNGKRKNLVVEDVKMSGSTLTIKFDGIDSPEEAKKLSGWEIYVDRDKAAKLLDGEYYLADLCKCTLVSNGKAIGEIKSVSSNGVSDMLEVIVDGKTKLIPFLEMYIGDVDIAAGTVELIEAWLLE